jgi:hypothetical protein
MSAKNPETSMAGESVLRIRDKEKEASELVHNARLDAKRIVQYSLEKKPFFIEEKDELLKKEEARIRDAYMRQSQAIILDLQAEEERGTQRIAEACEKNVSRVAEFIAGEIVKD